MSVRLSLTALLWSVTVFGSVRIAAAQGDGGDPPTVVLGAGRGVQGTVTAVTTDHLTLRTERGETYQVAVSPNTRVMKSRSPIRLADVHPGDGVGAMGELDSPNKTVHALYLVVVDADQVKKAREALGKTWISGKVTAIDETRITVLRSDQVSQVILVDEDTSFRRGGRALQMAVGGGALTDQGSAPTSAPASAQDAGESVTLADLKVGFLVAGPGALKNGVFVPTVLGISDPATGRGGRRRQGNSAAGSDPFPAAPAEPKQR